MGARENVYTIWSFTLVYKKKKVYLYVLKTTDNKRVVLLDAETTDYEAHQVRYS